MRFRLGSIVLALIFLSALNPGFDALAAGEAGAQRVSDIISKIESAPPLENGKPERVALVSEDELNAYIAHRIATQKDPVISELKVQFMDAERVGGRFTMDFTGLDIPMYLSPYMTFRFAGRTETAMGKGRLQIDELYLKDEPVSVAFLDMVIGVMATLNGYEPVRFEDWHPLPYGIRHIRTRQGASTVYY